jgi:hypothetical protein
MNLTSPTWIPEAVARVAARLHDACPQTSRTAIERLVRDRRMRSVWTELRKRVRENYRTTDRFSHPAVSDALVWLQYYANFCEWNAAYWRKQGDETRAIESEKEAAEMRNLRPQDAACVLLFGVSFTAATLGFRTRTLPEWRELANPCASIPLRFIVRRRRGDQRARAAGIAIGNALEALFGSPCYKITAALTAVALNVDAPPPGRVREWFRRYPSRN